MESLNHPTSSFGGEPPPTAEPYMTVEELTEELLLQKVLLASLDDSDPDYENISSGIEKEIERLTTRLEVLNPKKKKKPTTTTASRTTSAQSGLSGSTASSLAISTPGSANSPYLSSSARQNTATGTFTPCSGHRHIYFGLKTFFSRFHF